MARQRMIKPEFWQDETISQLSRDARLLYIGMWNHADDYGRLELTSRKAKVQMFPYDEDITSADVQKMIDELVSLRRILLYKDGGKHLAFIPHFADHQTVNRPIPSKLPAYQDSLSIHGVINEDSVNGHGAVSVGSVSTHAQVKLKEIKLKEDNTHSVVFPFGKSNDVCVNDISVEQKEEMTHNNGFSVDYLHFRDAYACPADQHTNKPDSRQIRQRLTRDKVFPGAEIVLNCSNYQKQSEPWQEHRARNQPCIMPLAATRVDH